MFDFYRGLEKIAIDGIRRGVPRQVRAAARSGNNLAIARTIGGGTANILSRWAVIPSLLETAQGVFNPKDNIITALQNLGTSVENQFAAPGRKRRYVGSNPAAVAANRRLDRELQLATNLPAEGQRDFGDDYKEKELATGAAAELFRPGAGFPGQQATPMGSPQARAEAQERSRIAQLTEQDPLFKKYRVAELTDAYNKAKGDERERIGLEIWATTNPSLAKQVPPGQVGYRTSAAMSGTQVFGSNMPGITQATYQQASEGANNIPYYGMNAPNMSAYGLGANAQQIAFSPSGQPPVPMLGKDVFNKGFDIPSSEDLTQTQLALLKRAFEGRLK